MTDHREEWVLVPKKPTLRMAQAVREETRFCDPVGIYQKMLAVAPTHLAITHCDNCGCDWLDNGLNPVGCPYCKPRACTCHPDDRPDGPCRERYAASECQALASVDEALVERIAALLYEEATDDPWIIAGIEQPGPDRDYYRGLARKIAALAAQPPADDDDEVVFIDGVGAARSSIKSCRDGVQWIIVGDRIYWPLSDSDAKRLHSACCGNGSFDGPSAPVGMEAIREAFDEISGLCRHLRQGGPAPEDLQDLSDALDEAVGIAANMLHALPQQPAAVDEAVVEAVARAICVACEERPDSQGDARGNEFRWQDYRDTALAAISAFTAAQQQPAAVEEALRELEGRVQPDEALLRQALKALERGAWDTLDGKNAAAAIRERLEGEESGKD